MKRCPRCREEIEDLATKCPHCFSEFEIGLGEKIKGYFGCVILIVVGIILISILRTCANIFSDSERVEKDQKRHQQIEQPQSVKSENLQNNFDINDLSSIVRIKQLTGHEGTVGEIAFSPNGKLLMTGSDWDATIKLWLVDDWTEWKKISGFKGDNVSPVSFNPDGKYIAGCDLYGIRQWSTSNAEEVESISTTLPMSFSYSPNGKLVAYASMWDKKNVIKIYSLKSRSIVRELSGHSEQIHLIKFSPDGKLLITSSADRKTLFWSTNTWDLLKIIQDYTESLSFSSKGDLFVTQEGLRKIVIWSTETLTQVDTLVDDAVHYPNGYTSVVLSSNGQILAGGCSDGTVKLWSIPERRILSVHLSNSSFVKAVAFSPDNRFLSSGNENGTITIWKLIFSDSDFNQKKHRQVEQPKSMKSDKLQDGLVAYYPFNGNANDESGNGHNGRVLGASLAKDRFGKSNRAYYFDQANDYILIQDSDLLDFTTAASFSFWIKIDADIDYRQEGGGPPHIFSKGATFGDLSAEYAFLIYRDFSLFQFSDTNNQHHNYKNYPVVGSSVWVHIVCVYKNSTLTMYRDGINVGKENVISQIRTSNEPLYIGHRYAPPQEAEPRGTYKGIIDDIRFYNRALTESEIQSLYFEGR